MYTAAEFSQITNEIEELKKNLGEFRTRLAFAKARKKLMEKSGIEAASAPPFLKSQSVALEGPPKRERRRDPNRPLWIPDEVVAQPKTDGEFVEDFAKKLKAEPVMSNEEYERLYGHLPKA